MLFGGLLVGANAMQRAIQVPASLVIALNGLVVIFVVASNDVRRRVNRAVEVREERRRHDAAAAVVASP